MITTVVVWWQCFSLKSGLKCANFFFDSQFLILVLVQRPTTSKNGRSFQGEVVTFISVIGGIRDIFEARFIM
jgi:hypothetical protein